MEKNLKNEAISFLIKNGYKFKGNKVIAPDADSPEDAISIQDEIADFGYKLQYVGNNLNLIKI